MISSNDDRTVLTLDAGGTNFRFSAMRCGEELFEPISLPSKGHDLQLCLANIRAGFTQAQARAGAVHAISFAFPGPTDYASGIIGDLFNLPGFRGGVALGPMLEDHFAVPVFINNDGDLFVLGEALAGFLPEVNQALAAADNPKRFRHLFGITLGTGFGAGLVIDGKLFLGDNGAGAEIWCTRNKFDFRCSAEEGVAIRAVRRVYAEGVGLPQDQAPEPKEIERIARQDHGLPGQAAREAYRRLGEVAGDALANAVTLVDALIVVGGGLAGATDLILPALVGEMNAPLQTFSGAPLPRTELRSFNWEDEKQRREFLGAEVRNITVPGSGRTVSYDPLKRTAVGLSRLGTSRAVAIGAWAFALQAMDKHS